MNECSRPAACWSTHLPAEYNLVFVIAVICSVCKAKESIFKPRVIHIWVQPAYAGAARKFTVKELFVDSIEVLLQRAVAAHCRSPRLTTHFWRIRAGYLWHKNSLTLLEVRLCMNERKNGYDTLSRLSPLRAAPGAGRFQKPTKA